MFVAGFRDLLEVENALANVRNAVGDWFSWRFVGFIRLLFLTMLAYPA